MSEKWQVYADDATITTRAFEERLEQTENPRHRRMLEMLIEHDRAEAVSDLDRVMATLSPEPEYGRYWGPGGNTGPKGSEAVRAYYEEMFASNASGNLQPRFTRLVVDDSTVVAEFTVTSIWPSQVAEELGCIVGDESGHYAARRHLIIVIPFDDDQRICGEYSYGGALFDWERIPDDELSPGYRSWAARVAPGSVNADS